MKTIMNQYKKIVLVVAVFGLVLGVTGLASAHAVPLHPAQTLATAGKTDACDGLSQLGGSCGGGQSTIGNVLSGVVSIISFIAGAIAVVMIIISGIRFVTSGGDSNKVAAAKTALIYALIGVAVLGASQLLIHFVISNAANA